MREIRFVIPGNTPSKKRGFRPFNKRILPSINYEKWYEETFGKFAADKWAGWKDLKILIAKIPRPFVLQMKFFRKTRQAFDYINMAQSIQDALVKAEIIEEDNMDTLIPEFLPWEKDKEYPRCEVVIKRRQS